MHYETVVFSKQLQSSVLYMLGEPSAASAYIWAVATFIRSIIRNDWFVI